MKEIEITIKGTSSILMHNVYGMLLNKKKNVTKQYDYKIEAEKVAYRTKKKNLCVPSRNVKAMLLGGSSWYKFGSKSSKPIIAGCTRIEPEEILIYNSKNKIVKNYEIDLQPVVIQGKDRIIRARPRIDDWVLNFRIIYDDSIIKKVEDIRNILEEAGKRVGLLDNRPQKYGEHGCFEVVKFKVL